MLSADLIKYFEGLRLRAYPDPASGGKPYTIGYGCTGPDIGPDTVWTQQEADDALAHRLISVESVIHSLVKIPLTDNRLAALASLAWNIGTWALAKSTLMKEYNLGNIQEAADQFLVWNRAHGFIYKPLMERRRIERAVFLGVCDSLTPDIDLPT